MNVLVILSAVFTFVLCTKRAKEPIPDSQLCILSENIRGSNTFEHDNFILNIREAPPASEDEPPTFAPLRKRVFEFIQSPYSIYRAQTLDQDLYEFYMLCENYPKLEKFGRALKVMVCWTASGAVRIFSISISVSSMANIFNWMQYDSGGSFRPCQHNEIPSNDAVPIEGLTGDATLRLLHAALCRAVHPSILQQVSKFFHKTTRLDAVFKFPENFEKVIRSLAYTSKLWPFLNALVNGRGPFGALNDDQRAVAASLFAKVPMVDLLQFLVIRRVELGEPVDDNLIQSVILRDKSPERMAELEATLTNNVTSLDRSSSEVRKIMKRIKQLATNTTDATSVTQPSRN